MSDLAGSQNEREQSCLQELSVVAGSPTEGTNGKSFIHGRARTRKLARIVVVSFALWGTMILCAPSSFAHEGDNEAFVERRTAPREVRVDEQGLKALGITTATVASGPMQEVLRATGEVKAAETQQFDVNPPVSGMVKSVDAKQGDRVRKGQVLGTIHSIEVASTVTNLLAERTRINSEIARTKTQYQSEITLQEKALELAKYSLDREESLLKEGISARKSYQEAKNAYEQAQVKLSTSKERFKQEVALLDKQLAVTTNTVRSQLQIMGLDSGAIDRALASGSVEASVPITAPVSGVVTAREITVGERVFPDKKVFSIVNLSPIWVMVDVYQEQIPHVKVGQLVNIRTPSKHLLAGRISSVGSLVEDETRTLHVRIITDNPNGILRPGMFVTAEIILGLTKDKQVIVPGSAIIPDGDRSLVYVKHEDHFDPVYIETGLETANGVEVIRGLSAGDQIVVSGARQLLAQTTLKQESNHAHEQENHEDHHEHQSEEAAGLKPEGQLLLFFGAGVLATLVAGAAIFAVSRLVARKRAP